MLWAQQELEKRLLLDVLGRTPFSCLNIFKSSPLHLS
jgi:hypothetical protein